MILFGQALVAGVGFTLGVVWTILVILMGLWVMEKWVEKTRHAVTRRSHGIPH